MKQDAEVYAIKCDKCQRHVPIPHMPPEMAQQGMDIVGPLSTATSQKKFMLVATDYFNKWVEVEAYANIKDKDVTKFI